MAYIDEIRFNIFGERFQGSVTQQYTKTRTAPNRDRRWCWICGRLCRQAACDHCCSKHHRFDARIADALEHQPVGYRQRVRR